MARVKRLIPFKYLPGSWGLKGMAYARAEAEYHYDGEDLQRRLCDIDHADDMTARALRLIEIDKSFGRIDAYEADKQKLALSDEDSPKARLKLDRKHGRIEAYQFEKEMVSLGEESDHEKELALLDIEYRYSKISENEYEKSRAALLNEPWIGIIDHGYDPSLGVNGMYMEFDWNAQWILFLRAHGYFGSSEAEIVERWFADVNKAIEADENYPFTEQRWSHRVDRGDGRADYH